MTAHQVSAADAPAAAGPDRASARAEIARLAEKIVRHRQLYHVHGAPEISDPEYDLLYERLKALEAAHPDLARPHSPTRTVGAEVPADRFPTCGHVTPMLSLDSAHDIGAVRRFDERVRQALAGADEQNGTSVRYALEPKLDGASVELVYVAGVLDRAVTRGDGRVGEVVTRNLSAAPRRLNGDATPVPAEVAIRGEAIMRRSDFAALNEARVRAQEETYRNPRNVAAGTLRQLDPHKAAVRPLTLIAFDVMKTTGGPELRTHADALAAMRAWGLRIPDRVGFTDSVDGIAAYHSAFDEDRDELDYEIDGVVAKLDDLAAREAIGSTSHHPRWAVAYKFPPRRREARVAAIAVQVGRTGVLTPVARLEATLADPGLEPEDGVMLGGVLVSRASLHNREEVERKDIRVGDRVLVQRAGDVIPQVVARIAEEGRERGSSFAMPEACPACGAAVSDRGPFTVCSNHFGCGEQLKARIAHFASRHALDIEGLGARTADLLVDAGLVREPADLFDLTPEQLIPLDGFAEQSARNLVSAIRARREVDLARFLVALGIPEVGVAVARELAARFQDLDAVRRARPEQLEELDGFGPLMSAAISRFFAQPETARALGNLAARGVKPIPPEAPEIVAGGSASEWRGRRVVLTGALEAWTRSELKRVLAGLGAQVTGSVSGRTDVVVAGTGAGAKLARARELGVEVLDEAQLLERLAPR